MKLPHGIWSYIFPELTNLDTAMEKAVEVAVKSAELSVALPHAQQKLQLRENQLRELADKMRSLDPEQVYIITLFQDITI